MVIREKKYKSFRRGYDYVRRKLKTEYDGKARAFDEALANVLGQACRTCNYRYVKGLFRITPETAEQLKALFESYGCAEPFDESEE